MLHIFLLGVIKGYLKVKIAFVSVLFLFYIFFIAQNCNGELHFRPSPSTTLGTVCLKEKKKKAIGANSQIPQRPITEKKIIQFSNLRKNICFAYYLQVLFQVIQIGYC